MAEANVKLGRHTQAREQLARALVESEDGAQFLKDAIAEKISDLDAIIDGLPTTLWSGGPTVTLTGYLRVDDVGYLMSTVYLAYMIDVVSGLPDIFPAAWPSPTK